MMPMLIDIDIALFSGADPGIFEGQQFELRLLFWIDGAIFSEIEYQAIHQEDGAYHGGDRCCSTRTGYSTLGLCHQLCTYSVVQRAKDCCGVM